MPPPTRPRGLSGTSASRQENLLNPQWTIFNETVFYDRRIQRDQRAGFGFKGRREQSGASEPGNCYARLSASSRKERIQRFDFLYGSDERPLPNFVDGQWPPVGTRRRVRQPTWLTPGECQDLCATARYARSVEESKALDRATMPMIIISASGMATGGRVLHHLKAMAPDPRNTILFAGFQAAGTRGARMVNGASEINVHGQQVPVRASVENLHTLSAHADVDEIMGWLRGFASPPLRTFITHGEPDAAEALRERISDELDWRCEVPVFNETANLVGFE